MFYFEFWRIWFFFFFFFWDLHINISRDFFSKDDFATIQIVDNFSFCVTGSMSVVCCSISSYFDANFFCLFNNDASVTKTRKLGRQIAKGLTNPASVWIGSVCINWFNFWCTGTRRNTWPDQEIFAAKRHVG